MIGLSSVYKLDQYQFFLIIITFIIIWQIYGYIYYGTNEKEEKGYKDNDNRQGEEIENKAKPEYNIDFKFFITHLYITSFLEEDKMLKCSVFLNGKAVSFPSLIEYLKENELQKDSPFGSYVTLFQKRIINQTSSFFQYNYIAPIPLVVSIPIKKPKRKIFDNSYSEKKFMMYSNILSKKIPDYESKKIKFDDLTLLEIHFFYYTEDSPIIEQSIYQIYIIMLKNDGSPIIPLY